jgi:hypothetical protein
LCKLLYYGKHTLDDSVLIAEQFRGFLGMMMRATALSLGFMRRVNALRLVHFNSIFHNYFSSPVMHLALSILSHVNSPIVAVGLPIHHRTPRLPGGGLVNTVRIAAHWIARERVGVQAAAAAGKFKFAHAALPLDLRIDHAPAKT